MQPNSPRPLRARAAYLVAGSAVSTYGYLLTVIAELGSGPLFAVQDGIQLQLGLSRSTAAIAIGLALTAGAAVLRAPLGVGTLLIPLTTGGWIALMEPTLPHVSGVVTAWAAFVGGTAVMMLGAVLIVDATLGTSAMDATMLAIARRTGWSPARARLLMEVALATIGFAIRGQVGAGTVVMGVMVGPSYAFWTRTLELLRSPRATACTDPAPGTRAWVTAAADTLGWGLAPGSSARSEALGQTEHLA